MLTRREPIVMFGAGIGARRAWRCLRHRYRLVALVDNDSAKHGTRLLGRPVIGPRDLERFADRRIFVASMFADEITDQLRNELGIPPERIARVPDEIVQGAYEVSPWTYAALGLIAVASVGVLGLVWTAAVRLLSIG